MTSFTPFILAAMLSMCGLPLCQAQSASLAGNGLASKATESNAVVYSCDLRAQFNQCRQFAIDPKQASERLPQAEQSCQSLGGRFEQRACPGEALVARCTEVKFRRDLTYDNSYYAGEPSKWTPASLEYACAHLPGRYHAASSPMPKDSTQR